MMTLLNDRKFQINFLIYSMILLFWGRQLDGGLTNFDDAFYAQKAKEIFDSKSLWLVTYHGQPSFENPPLVFWMMALGYKMFGVSTYAAIFFPALLGLGTVLTTYAFARNLYGDWVAFFSAIVLIFPGMFLDGARRAMLDVPLAFFVTAALFAFWKARSNPKYFLLYGLFTAFGVWTKSVLGFFPLVIGFVYLFCNGGWRGLLNIGYWTGAAIGVSAGSIWYVANWMEYGDYFYQSHFGRPHMTLFGASFETGGDILFFLGYVRDFWKTHWPWFPFAVAGIYVFGRNAWKEKDEKALLLFLWPVVVFVIMSLSANQTLRYLFMIFPALAIVTAKLIGDWATPVWMDRLVCIGMGSVMVGAIVINSTPAEIKVTLKPSSVEVRLLSRIINLNVDPGGMMYSYKLSKWNPRHAVVFYTDRYIEYPIADPEELFKTIKNNPRSTWLTATFRWKELDAAYPGKFYLIHAEKTYAYFTAMENRDNVVYDFSSREITAVR